LVPLRPTRYLANNNVKEVSSGAGCACAGNLKILMIMTSSSPRIGRGQS